MERPETNLHLYNPPLYHAGDGSWQSSYREAALHTPGSLHWQPAALLSTLAFSFVCGDLTPIREIRRKPWLSGDAQLGQEPELLDIPAHGLRWDSYENIARGLGDRLANEAERACRGRDEIYVLLSGGLDSRVTAGTIARLLKEGRLASPPTAVTWGEEDSRDVVYAREIAKMLGWEWIHVPMPEETLLRNIDWTAQSLASMIFPVHQHKMEWFAGKNRDALVLATSYGDGVGRAEFSGKHLLELDPLRPLNAMDLLAPAVYVEASAALKQELRALHARGAGQPKYVLCEYEMHEHYTRGLLAHAMNSVNDYVTAYQMFTDPEVYSFMWQHHPALRFNEVYRELLDQLDPRLARMPWARTNQSMKGRASGSAQLRARFHVYSDWISGPLYEPIVRRINLERIAAMGIFNMDAVRGLIERVPEAQGPIPPHSMAWFASLTRLAAWMEELGCSVEPYQAAAGPALVTPATTHMTRPGLVKRVRAQMERSPFLVRSIRRVRRYLLRRSAIRKYRPTTNPV